MKAHQDITSQLIRQLDALRTDGMLPFEQRLVETAVWYHKNKDRIPRDALDKRLDFIEKTLDIVLEMLALSLDRIQLAEGRNKSASLWLPNGMQGMGRHFG